MHMTHGSINYAEFCRIMTSDNVHKMKNTLNAGGGGTEGVTAAHQRVKMAQGSGANVIDGHNVKLRRTGPGLDAIRRAHKTLRTQIGLRYPSLKACFREIDADNSGLVRRGELRTFLRRLSKTIPDKVISALIDYVDSDGDAKTLSLDEFVTMMKEDFLA